MRSSEGSPWSAPGVVAGFAQSPPNPVLVQFAWDELRRPGAARVLDIGCGAGRNAVPLAQQGWEVIGLDDSSPMLAGAARRAHEAGMVARVRLVLATMAQLPVSDRSCDLIVAHGIWNLARSGGEFRRAVREVARVARPGAGLFVFTFSRNTLAPEVSPVHGESFVFTEFSGEPQCFVTEAQLLSELRDAGFVLAPGTQPREYNRPQPGAIRLGGPPVIHEAAFRYAG